jgi:hypothetical protein
MDELGLVASVEHEQYFTSVNKKKWNKKLGCVETIVVKVPNPQQLHVDKGITMIVGETTVELYEKEAWLNLKKFRDPKEILHPVGIGLSFCSAKDQFDRRIGRVKALKRALDSFMNSEAKNVNESLCPVCNTGPCMCANGPNADR